MRLLLNIILTLLTLVAPVLGFFASGHVGSLAILGTMLWLIIVLIDCMYFWRTYPACRAVKYTYKSKLIKVFEIIGFSTMCYATYITISLIVGYSLGANILVGVLAISVLLNTAVVVRFLKAKPTPKEICRIC